MSAIKQRLLVCASVVMGVVVAAWLRPTPPVSTPSMLDIVRLSGTLERQDWPSGGMRAIVAGGSPMHMTSRGSAIASLRCMNWSVEHLVALGANGHLQAFGQVSGGPSAEFVLARGREREFDASRAVSTQQLSLAAFWERSARSAVVDPGHEGYEHLYHSGPLSALPEQLGLEADG